jgi:HsdM N-terminal domain
MPRSKATVKASTGRNELAAAIKTARDVMRKDAGLSGDLDRTPQLAWLLFLKAFDDLERKRALTERQFRPAIDAPYRWRDWAADPVDGRTGQVLLDFVNGELLPYLRELRGTGSQDPRDVLAAVFKETFNRMLSGYLLRDVLNVVHRVDFTSSDDIHTMAQLYESMLRELRTRPATPASSTLLDPSSGSSSSRSIPGWARWCSTPLPAPADSWRRRWSICGRSCEPPRSGASSRPTCEAWRRSRCRSCSG